ncbi:hypothetical protein O181_106934 [Austropuccinia psidii MF-1]|uniref:Integrase zinc-binding domain-containing protein n=1 Tax=Austropuccinia psidii MF-1 TaxID=1389203 RepID=A0A9Q3JT36_9BASI|nr:hypothetical protein [Austropuccinia psidii MF-1]
MSKHTCVMILCSKMIINTTLLECHDNIYSGHLSEERTMGKIETCAWWPSWRKDVIEYCHGCDRCQKTNKATGKRFCLIIYIQETSTPWEVIHMHWVTALPPGGGKRYTACLVIVDSLPYSPKELKDSFTGPFIKARHGTNAVQVELSGKLGNKHPAFPVSIAKNYTSSDKELFPLGNKTHFKVTPIYENEEKKLLKFLKERRLKGKNESEYLVRYRKSQHEE